MNYLRDFDQKEERLSAQYIAIRDANKVEPVLLELRKLNIDGIYFDPNCKKSNYYISVAFADARLSLFYAMKGNYELQKNFLQEAADYMRKSPGYVQDKDKNLEEELISTVIALDKDRIQWARPVPENPQ